MKIFKTDIRTNTFLKRGVKQFNDIWGVYYVTGYQGTGKSYFAVYLSYEFDKKYEIITNIHSLRIPSKKIDYFVKLDEVLDNVEEYKLFIIDEISKKYSKNSPPDKKFFSWLQQSRKRHRVVILITQEWKEVPMWLRRPARYMYATHQLFFFPIFITTVGDALNTVFNDKTMEWECPLIKRIVYKRNKQIANMYDTLEPINDL